MIIITNIIWVFIVNYKTKLMLNGKYFFLINKSLSRNHRTELDLCLYTPAQTLRALKNNEKIKKWHKYILNDYIPPITDILLLFPCAARKPYTEGSTKSRNYQILYSLLNQLNLRKFVSLHTISEPLGIIGEKNYEIMPIYDNPGLFQWFTRKYNLKWDENIFDRCINYLGKIIGLFLKKFEKRFKKIIAFVKPDSTHYKMMEVAKKYLNNDITIGPLKSEIREIKNNYVWMANKSIQDLFKTYIDR